METVSTTLPTTPVKKPIKIFPIVIIVICVLFIILFAVNVYQWNRIRNNATETSPVTRSEANVQFWLNLIWLFVALGVIVYAFFELFKTDIVAPTFIRVKKPVTTTAVAAPLLRVAPTENISLYEAAAMSGTTCAI